MTFNTADLLDDSDGRLISCQLQLVRFGAIRAFDGTIRTVRCFEDTALVKQVLAEKAKGDVLVIDGAGSLRTALMGGKTASLAAANGWSGMVINGAVRDVDELADVQIGIKALGTNPTKPSQTGIGDVDVPISFGGVWFRPGKHLWSDADGVITDAVPL